MSVALRSLMDCGTKLWLDSIDPQLVRENRALGATGATSNPVIVSDLLRTGRFDDAIERRAAAGLGDGEIAWQVTDSLVSQAEDVFRPVFEQTRGNDGYVSFEVDPLLEDPASDLPHDKRVQQYLELGTTWAEGHPNRLIKVPATPAGLDALEDLAAAGVSLNVTLIFTARQYRAAREAIWRGARRRKSLDRFKSVYSIFISRIDVYTQKHVPQLSPAAQGLVGIVNAKRLWRENADFWSDKRLPLAQEIVFASTGTKRREDPPWKYVEALAGSDIQTNPPETNAAVAASGRTFVRTIDQLPPAEVLREIDTLVDFERLERVLMDEGIAKFADPQKALLAVIAGKREQLVALS